MAGHLLALQLIQQEAQQTIPRIKDETGKILTHPTDITEAFKAHYSTLYTANCEQTTNQQEALLSTLPLPTLTPAQTQVLNLDISEEEVLQVIKDLPYHKAPRLDGFPAEYYRINKLKLAPLLSKMFNSISNDPPPRRDENKAKIVLILKPDKDPLDCASCRPFSLLNTDTKALRIGSKE